MQPETSASSSLLHVRPGTPLIQADALRLIGQYVEHYNAVRLHSAIGYVTPGDMLAGRQKIQAARDQKLAAARESPRGEMILPGETEAGSAGTQPY